MNDAGRRALMLAELESALRAQPVLEALLLRLELREPDANTDAEAAALALVEFQEDDGSWQGSLLATAERLLLLRRLLPLDEWTRAPGVAAAVSYVQRRADQAGAVSAGCDADRHADGLCHHFTSGFFAAAPQPLNGLQLESGQRLGTDADARLAASALALAALQAWQVPATRAMELQRRSLERWVRVKAGGRVDLMSTAALVCVLRALLSAEPTPAGAAALQLGLDRLAAGQRADGTWPTVQLYFILEFLADCAERGVSTPAAAAALDRACELVCSGPSAVQRNGEPAALRAAVRALRCLTPGRDTMVEAVAFSHASAS